MTMWCDPPVRRRRGRPRGRVWAPLLEPVMERPGQWALVRQYPDALRARTAIAGLNQSTRGGGTLVIPPGRWEFCSRQTEEVTPRWGIWARYLGPEEAR